MNQADLKQLREAEPYILLAVSTMLLSGVAASGHLNGDRSQVKSAVQTARRLIVECIPELGDKETA